MPRKIFDLDISEITLAGKAANRKKFFIKKQETPMKELVEKLKKFMAEDEDKVDEALTKEEIEKIEKLGEEDVKEMKSALEVLEGYKMEDMPDDALGAIRTLAKKASFGNSLEKAKKVNFLDELLDIEKAGARFSKATVEQLKKVREMMDKLIGDKEKVVTKGHKDLPDDVKARLEELERLRREKKETLEKQEKEKEKVAEERIEKIEKESKDLKEELEDLKKKKGKKQSIDGQEGDKEVKKGAGDEKIDEWPSVYVPGLPESDD